MADLISMVCPPGMSCPLTSGFGLPEILLWVLSFALIYTAVTRLKIMDKKPGVLVALALSFFVLMAVPAALITAIAGMSTGFLALMTGLIIVVAIFATVAPMSKVPIGTDDKGNVQYAKADFLGAHSTAVAVVLLLLTGLIIWTYGGAQLIGVGSLPVIGAVPLVLIVVGIAVLWMIY
jgi:hypothetical protein